MQRMIWELMAAALDFFDCWSAGMLDPMSVAVLECYSDGMLAWRRYGALECWSAGVLAWWQ